MLGTLCLPHSPSPCPKFLPWPWGLASPVSQLPSFLLPVWADPTSPSSTSCSGQSPRPHPWEVGLGCKRNVPACAAEGVKYPSHLSFPRTRPFPSLARALPPMGKNQLSHEWCSTCQVHVLISIAQECLCPACRSAAVCLCTKHSPSLSFQFFMGTVHHLLSKLLAPGVFWNSELLGVLL